MTLEAMQAVVARLLTDAAYQRRFFAASPGEAAEHGLTPEEFAVLRRLDAAKLGITVEGYAGKRLERVASAFPRTLAALDAVESGARFRYLERTDFPPDEAAERATFLAYVRTGGGWPEAAHRFARDLAALEVLLYDHPPPTGLPSYRWRPEVLRPRRSPQALTLATRGPLDLGLAEAEQGRPPTTYLEEPHEFLVLREGAAVRLEDLAGPAGALLRACDGAQTVAALAARFGPAAEAAVERWLRLRVVGDAGPP